MRRRGEVVWYSRPGDGLLEVGVVEDDVGRLSSELKGDVLEVGFGGGLHDHTSDEGRSREGNLRQVVVSRGSQLGRGRATHLLDLHVRGDGGSSDGSETSEDVDDTGGEDLGDETSDEEGGERGRLGGLDDDGVSGRECGSNLPGDWRRRTSQ
jgi:hypothetical protein